LPCVDVKIKWPNDLYFNGLKIGGILCTSTYKSKKFNVSAGNRLVLWVMIHKLVVIDHASAYITGWTVSF